MLKKSITILLFMLSMTGFSDPYEPYNLKTLEDFRLQTTSKVKPYIVDKVGKAWVVSQDNFPALHGVTCYTVEVWEEAMRIPHWHPNTAELGYVISGTIEVIIWRSPGETTVETLTEGMCWFIPQSALHSLNNIGDSKAELLVGFANDRPADIDLPVAFNGIPVPIREAMTSPHSELRKWQGVISNPLVGRFRLNPSTKSCFTGSPYKFDLAAVPPLFSEKTMGSVVWGVKSNWGILENISMLRAHLKPGTARDPIWYPDAGTLYVVSKGSGQFHIVVAGYEPTPLNVNRYDYVYVPVGVLHTFINTSPKEDFEVIAFFNNANPKPEVSLSVASSFFPPEMLQDTMTKYGNVNLNGDPLADLKNTQQSPYLIRVSEESSMKTSGYQAPKK